MGDFVVHLGARDILIRPVEFVVPKDGEPDSAAEGYYHHSEAQICTRFPESEIEDTVCHELTHAMLDVAGIKMPEAEEEEFVSRFAPWLHALIWQNPHLITLVAEIGED